MKVFGALLLSAVLSALAAPAVYADARDLPDFSDLVERVGPAVVGIRTTERADAQAANGAPDDEQLDELFRRFFGVPMPKDPNGTPSPSPRGRQPRVPPTGREVPHGIGSGFVISPDGYVLTNAHVVEGAAEIYVTLTDKREFKGRLVGSDERTDVALIKIDAKDLGKMTIGDSNSIRVGQWVLAIGSPFGLENTVTAGIVSAKGRETGDYLPFIQTDVPINPGNSGGPLINMRGEVIGINSQILSESGGSIGISFAIPIDEAMHVVEQLRNTGKVTRGRLGVQIRDLAREEADILGIRQTGAMVSRVEKDSPAVKAGVHAGDVIVKFDGHPIERSSDLPRLVGDTRPGTRSTLQVWRNGALRDIPIVVAELEQPAPTALVEPEAKPVATDVLGLAVADLTEDKRHDLGIPGGVEVVGAEGLAASAELRLGDIILSINNTDVASAKQFNDIVAKLDPKKPVFVLMRRGDAARFVALRPAG
jgi:serine protease Do